MRRLWGDYAGNGASGFAAEASKRIVQPD